MKAKEYSVLVMAVESGVMLGWQRAHKHVKKPDEAAVREAIMEAVLNEICEWFDFPTHSEEELHDGS